MRGTDFEKDVKSAMKLFLLFASLIYGAAFYYSFTTKNSFAQGLILFAATVVAGIIYYANKKLE